MAEKSVLQMEKEIGSPNIFTALSGWYDYLFSETNNRRIERAIINVALISFALHLLLIFIAKHVILDTEFAKQIPTNYLKTIYTPFSIILFYEVLTLILILPRSIAIFIGKQYEIITLITIRSFFHDIADFDLDKHEIYTLAFLREIGLDLLGALLMFFFTVLYYKTFDRTKKTKSSPSQKRTRFIHIKKTAAVFLSILLIVLSVFSFSSWMGELYAAVFHKGEFPNPNVVFYKDFFSVMIFVDVFLLILSFIYSSTYDLIFRNAGFVISTILVRVALTAEKPYNILFALTSVIFGVTLISLFVFFNQKNENEVIEVPDDGV